MSPQTKFNPRARALHLLRRMSLSRKSPGVHLCSFNGLNVALDLSEPVHRSIYVSGDFEPELSSVLKRVIRPGDTFLDIGANMGWHTLQLLASRDIQMAVAIEPQQRNVDLLVLALRANNLTERCDVKRLAIMSKSGKVILKRFKGLDSMHTSVYPLGDLPFEEEEVPCESIDGLLITSQSLPAVIKCDVEGSELSVLQGAHETLSGTRGSPPMWLLEANYETSAMAGYFPWDLVECGAKYGYSPYTIRGTDIVSVSPKGLRHGDTLVLAISDLHAARFR
jgi:FkbM family methyltransferase